MVVQSVINNGAISFPKNVASSFPSHFRDSQLVCQPADSNNHSFYTLGRSLADDPANVKCYSVAGANDCAPAFEHAFILPDCSAAYLEAVRPVTQLNKECLSSVLDFADEAGCDSVFAVVKKDNSLFADILRSFNDVGFANVSPVGADMVKLRLPL